MEHYDDAAIAQLEARCKSNTHRLDEQARRQDDQEKRIDNIEELTTSVKVLATREERVERDVGEIKTDVKKLTEQPAKRWEKVVDTILAALAGAFVAWLIAGGA